MIKNRLFIILVVIFFIFFIAESLFEIDRYPNKHPEKLHKIVTVSRYIDNMIIGGISFVTILLIIILCLYSFYYELSQRYISFYFFLLCLNIFLTSISIVLTLIGFIAFENRSLLQWIFSAPVSEICWLMVLIVWFQEERKRLR